MTRTFRVAVIILALSAPANAQFVVIDHGNLAQAVLIAERTLREYETLVAQYATILRMSQGLGDMTGYRVPEIPASSHDVARWEYAGRWLQALNVGDAEGSAYDSIARRLELPGNLLQQLPPAGRRAVEHAYATVEITDAVVETASNQVGLVRDFGVRLRRAIDALERDVLNADPRSHEMTAILDKVAAGELVARRQGMAANQLLLHALEQLLARGKRLRDTEAATMNMRLGALRDGRAAGASIVRGAADDLRTWRQP
jgi:hypothetical protein